MSQVTARYPDGVARLEDVSLALAAGELCAVLGPNGAGKSTLIRLIAGLVAPSDGSVAIFGQSGLDPAARARFVAVVPQNSEVALGFSVREVVAMGRAPHQGRLMRETREDVVAVEAALEACGLAAIAERPVDALSGGEQKRTHIARALAQQAPILLLDEAAAHLDIRHATELYALVKEQVRSSGLACLMTTHDLNAAAQYADRVVLLEAGRVVADGVCREVMTEALLEATFGIPIEAVGDGRTFVPAPPRMST